MDVSVQSLRAKASCLYHGDGLNGAVFPLLCPNENLTRMYVRRNKSSVEFDKFFNVNVLFCSGDVLWQVSKKKLNSPRLALELLGQLHVERIKKC